jgi:RNA polymerase sigma-70 factor (ECF subfamily)
MQDPAAHPVVSDRSLLARVRRGDDDAATRLYYKYVRQLQSVVRQKLPGEVVSRIEPEDIVQSAFRSFFRRAGAGSYDVPEGGQLWKLLLTIALNKARNALAHHRAAKRDVGKSVAQHDLHPPVAADETARKFLEMVIEEFTCHLEPSQRQIIEMRIAGLEVAEIAEQTGRAKRSVERVLQGFRSELSARLDGELEGDRP